jgi:hypothetical protein
VGRLFKPHAGFNRHTALPLSAVGGFSSRTPVLTGAPRYSSL